MNLPRPIRRILVEPGAADYPMTRRILDRLPQARVEFIPHRELLRTPSPARAAWLPEAKSTLLLAVQKGPFRRPCPGTRNYICCGYQVLMVAAGCPMDCAYCILQEYLNVPAVTIFVNVEDLLEELRTEWAAQPEKIWRLGTGEFGDSLALDELMGLNERLIPFFSGQSQALLEIKSKWSRVEHLLPLGPNPRVVFAWSLNPPEVTGQEEKFTASLQARLRAASLAADAGFRLAFHFDPLIYFPGWEEAYRRTVARLAAAAPPGSIAWISLGGLRFLPAQRRLMLERFPLSRVAAQEMVRAPDGKLRYFKSLRIEIYSQMREWLARDAPGAPVYLCMESPRVWQAVFGAAPQEDDLAHRLNLRLEP